ncbi:MAG TPA: hypothetical protein VHJ17_08320 [Thermomonospora sp.]|nr:hypothetical protein [Thermomonospora sp.]
MRVTVGAAAAAVALSGLSAPGVTTANAATTTSENVTSQVAVCRYAVGSHKKIPVRSGPGKKYTVHGWISPKRKAPLFGTCATRGKGKKHWVKIVQGKFKGGWVWRNHLDRI